MIKILFVCLGNICRSPMAEFVLKQKVREKGLTHEFYIESAATSSEELGNPMHKGTIRKLEEENIPYTDHRARKLIPEDAEKFDLIIGMEESNIRNSKKIIGEGKPNQIKRLLDFSKHPKDIADPWYTGDFNQTYIDIEEGCECLLKYLLTKK